MDYQDYRKEIAGLMDKMMELADAPVSALRDDFAVIYAIRKALEQAYESLAHASDPDEF